MENVAFLRRDAGRTPDAGRFAASFSLRIPAPGVSKCDWLQSPLKARKIQTRFA